MTKRSWSIVSLCLVATTALAEPASPGSGQDIRRVQKSRQALWREVMQPPQGKAKSTRLQRAVEEVLAASARPGAEPQGASPPPAGPGAVAPSTRVGIVPEVEKTAETRPAATAMPELEQSLVQPDGSAEESQQTQPSLSFGPIAPRPPIRSLQEPLQAKPNPRPRASQVMSARDLGRLRALSSKGVTKPTALADALFLGEHYDPAYALYEMALKREPADNDHAWLLFQMANCKRVSDPDMALGLYRRLVAEHPNSLWIGLAQMQQDLIMWNQQARPRQVMAKAKAMAERLRQAEASRRAKPKAQQEPTQKSPPYRAEAPAPSAVEGTDTDKNLPTSTND